MWTTTTEGFCWLASAVAGGWQWESKKQREKTVENLSLVYVSQARNRSRLPSADREALDSLVELGEVISGTLSKAANRRIVNKINYWRRHLEEGAILTTLMKSNVIMLSPDRELFGVKIRQQSQTGHMSLSDLQTAYEAARQQYGWSEKRIDHLLGQQENAERLFYLLEGQGLVNVRFHTFMESVENKGIITILKEAGAYVTKGRAANKATWCNPYVLVLVAMELNPMLYAKTVIWLTDSLLINRIEAGTMYRGLSTALRTLGYQKPDEYATVGRALNFVVFGRHEAGLRQIATSEQLKELAGLEEKTAWAIEMGMIKSGRQLLDSLRNAWRIKFNRGIGGIAA